jgi:hypothetical protein
VGRAGAAGAAGRSAGDFWVIAPATLHAGEAPPPADRRARRRTPPARRPARRRRRALPAPVPFRSTP